MREIKYRAWGTPNPSISNKKEMLYEIELSDFWSTLNDFFNDSDLILMQYTEIKDKNGKEIYEGDIVRYNNKRMYKVEFGEALMGENGVNCNGWYLDSIGGKWDMQNLIYEIAFESVVIGNIYENPELLKSTKS